MVCFVVNFKHAFYSFFVLTEICETLSLPTATTTVATTVNIIKPIFMPLPPTVEQSTADQKPSGMSVHIKSVVLI